MNKRINLILILVGLCLLLLGGTHGLALREMRHARSPISSPELKGAPPIMVFTTIVLGGFRGIIADILWLRVSLLQDEGRYFEIVQLADWITKLEPHFTDVWTFHSWNMAYNISVMMPQEDDRWRWIRNGIQLLRDEGIQLNPSDPKLFFELGWMFQHKIGGDTDAMHAYYKAKWAGEMSDLLGGGYPDFDKLQPEAISRIRNEYSLDPDIMKRADEDYGPLDWRLPHSHAVYWGIRGRAAAQEEISMPCERLIYQSLSYLALHGSRTDNQPDQPPSYGPDFRLIPKTIRAYDAIYLRFPNDSIKTSFSYFLKDAIFALHKHHRDAEARDIFKKLVAEFPEEKITVAYEEFIKSRINKP
jgi:hypothetical protein